ncbi:MAG: hypothetical protein ACWGIK_26435 [Achromobacter pulmonis]
MSVNMNPAGVGAINMTDISGMDIETALMMVQTERTKLLDSQLKSQIEEVQKRNELTGALNDMQAKLNGMKGTLDSKDAKPGDRVSEGAGTPTNKTLATEYATQAFKLGMDPAPVTATPIKDAAGNVVGATVTGMPTREGLEKAIPDLKSKLDSASNSQQMDMLRLQSLSNKRNEAFDTMTNFIKKMQDSRSSIIGNMR